MEARPQVEAEVLAATRTDHVDVPETDPVDHTQPVVFGLGEHRVDSHPQPLDEVLEPGVGRGLQDYRVLCQASVMSHSKLRIEFEPAKRTLGVSLSPRGLPRVAPRHPQWDGASARPLVYVRLTIVID